MRAPKRADGAAQRELRYLAVAIKSNGNRVVMLASCDRREIDAFVATHRLFARSAGGDVRVESDEMRVVRVRR